MDSSSTSQKPSSTSCLYISAPGKLILFGEHAVVYDRTAIAGSIDLRTYVSLTPSSDNSVYLSLPDLEIEKSWSLKKLRETLHGLTDAVNDDESPSLEVILPLARELSGFSPDESSVQQQAILVFCYLLLGVVQQKSDLSSFKVSCRSELPTGVGLGSSGAYCVSLAASLLQTAGLVSALSVMSATTGNLTWTETDLDLIRKWATAAESIIHGKTSGLDTALCTYGGLASFNKQTGIEHLKTPSDLHVILVNSKVERNTLALVENVRQQREKLPSATESIFNAIQDLSKECEKIFNETQFNETETLSRLNDLCRVNHHLLNAIGVGHPKIDQICSSLSRHGIYPKITGAGGGGCVFAFLEKDTSEKLLNKINVELKELDCEVFRPCLGGTGVVEHTLCPEMFSNSAKVNTIAVKNE